MMQNNNVDLITRLVIRIILAFIQACWRELNPIVVKLRAEGNIPEEPELVNIFNWLGVHIYLEKVDKVWWIRITASEGIVISAKLTNGTYALNRKVCDALYVDMHKRFKDQEECDKSARRNCVDHLVSNLVIPVFGLIDRLKGTTREIELDKPFEEFSSILSFTFHGVQTVTSKYKGLVYIRLNHPVSDDPIYQMFAKWSGETSVKVDGMAAQALPYIERECNTRMAEMTKCIRNS